MTDGQRALAVGFVARDHGVGVEHRFGCCHLELHVGGAGAAARAAQVLAKPGRERQRHQRMLLPRADHRKHLAGQELVLAGLVGLPRQEGGAVERGFGQWQTHDERSLYRACAAVDARARSAMAADCGRG